MQPAGGLLIVFVVAGKITPWGGGGAVAPRLAVDGHAVGWCGFHPGGHLYSTSNRTCSMSGLTDVAEATTTCSLGFTSEY